MNNRELEDWNRTIAEISEARRHALSAAMRRRGIGRRIELWFVRVFAKFEATARRWRDEAMRGD